MFYTGLAFFSCCIQVLVLVVLLLFCMEGLILDREPQLHLIRYIYMHTYIYTHSVNIGIEICFVGNCLANISSRP